jgi:hypothetical protein
MLHVIKVGLLQDTRSFGEGKKPKQVGSDIALVAHWRRIIVMMGTLGP